MVKRRDKQYLLDTSPFFDKEELGFKTKLIPLEYNDKEDYYIARKVIVKSEEFVKQVIERKTNITEYYNLPNLSKTLMMYITQHCLEYNNLTFHFDADVFAKIIGITSVPKIYTAINKLIEAKYIARTETKKLYWINHNKYYKGNYLVVKIIESKDNIKK